LTGIGWTGEGVEVYDGHPGFEGSPFMSCDE